MKLRFLVLLTPACLLAASAVAQSPSAPSEELREAPSQARPGDPPEAVLTPPPDAEKVQAPSGGYVTLHNPAFPSREPVAPAAVVVDAGRRFDEADIARYFATGRRAEAKAAFDRGEYRRVRALLKEEGNDVPVRFLRALAAVRAEDHVAAAKEMTELAVDYPALADRCLTHGGLAHEQLGHWAEAAELFRQVEESSRLYPDARLGLARVLRKRGDLEGAMAALEPLAARGAPSWGRDLGAEALLAIADLAGAARDREAERAALERLWGRHPLSPLAKQAEARLKGRPRSPEALVARGEALVDAHRNRQGLEVLAPLVRKLELPDALACRAHFAYGKGLRKERRHTVAAAALLPVVERCTDEDLRVRALYVLGSSRSIVDLPRGVETYTRIAHDFPTHTFADDALFYAADLHVKLGQLDRALEQLAELARLYPDGDFAAEGLFKAFWIHRTRGEVDRALAVLAQLEQTYRNSEEQYEVERARYWRARMLEEQGKTRDAADLFESVAVNHPATYYGLMARERTLLLDAGRRERLQEALEAPPRADSPWPMYAGPLGKDPHFLAGVELLRLGFDEAVGAELLAAQRSGAPAESIRLLVHLLARAGDQRGAHAVARLSLRRELSGRITPKTRAVWEIAYPLAFRDMVMKHCDTAGVDPDLLQALMREESALDPKALSWAGAMGLTQLMPVTARGVASQLKLRRLGTEDLLQPELNIRLGSWYLGSLLRRFAGEKAFALASYNAGAGAVKRWRAESPEQPLDAWVEEIPIAETRGYVKRVLRSYNTYQLLYGLRPPKEAVSALGSVPGSRN
ncbi:MAG: transglycosylase SLT domain-containing protein [Myxococcaceae bacterium]|nr:transglycosylase SLT domain-containing protein [Myxococcaceae bacterium]